MTATLRASTPTYTSAASDTSFAIAMPTGWQPGDVVYIGIECRGTGASVTTPGGWTAVAPVFNPFGQTNTCGVVLRRVMQAGDADPLTVTVVSSRVAAIAVAAVGADTITPEDGVTPSEAAQSAATNSPVANSVTPTGADDLLLTFFGAGDPTTANVAMTFTQPSGMTLVAQASTAQAAATDAGIMIASLVLTSNAATGTKTATITPSSGSVACNSQAVTLVVKSAPAGGGISQAQPGRTWLRRFHHRQQLFAPAPTSFAVALAETGAADDSSFTVAATVPLAEAGTGADTLTVSATVPLAESGSGADTLAVTATVPLTEAGSAADTLAVSAAVPLAESGSSTDSLTVTAAVPLAESGSGTDTLSVNAGGTPTLAESGTGADTLAVTATVPLAEAGSAAQTLTVLAALALADAGAALDALSVTVTGPFTVGALTATDTPTTTQAPADKAANALTGLTGPSGGILTASDTRTGGPGG